MLDWHRADPPSQAERLWNDTIAHIQGMRNPFIDESSAAEGFKSGGP